jgi:hypothetical protein
VLVANRDLFRSRVPERPGGGTVDYVGPGAPSSCTTCAPDPACSSLRVDYATGLTDREEGGTPNILGDIRAGLVFEVRTLLEPARILEHELVLASRAVERLASHPRIRLLGPPGGPRLPILSFNVDGLHHELVSTLLDHLFGMQARAGCSCAGPYGHRLLGIDAERSERYRQLIHQGLLGAKPGWVRVSIPYYSSAADVEFLLSAVEAVADTGDAFVPLYRLSWREGSWNPISGVPRDAAPFHIGVAHDWPEGVSASAVEAAPSDDAFARERTAYLQEAASRAAALRERWRRSPPEWNRPTGFPELDVLTWFRYVETDALLPL